MNRRLLRHGFLLILLGLVSALFIPALAIPRLGLSAHTIAMIGGTLLIVVGVAWPAFALSERQRKWMIASWLSSSYLNWAACLLGAATGAGRATPIASAGSTASPIAEGLVLGLLVLVVFSAFVAVGLALVGLRGEAG